MLRLITISMILFLMISCDLFTPRDPEPPIDENDPYAWRPPTSAETVLENLSSAFPAHKLNYHLDCLSKGVDGSGGFVFYPDQGVAVSQPGVFDNWGYDEEENFITKLFQEIQEGDLQRLDWEIVQSSSLEDRYEIIADYELGLSYTAARGGLPDMLAGQATLTLVRNDDLLYEISVWQDLKSDTLPCWSDLKILVQ